MVGVAGNRRTRKEVWRWRSRERLETENVTILRYKGENQMMYTGCCNCLFAIAVPRPAIGPPVSNQAGTSARASEKEPD